MIKKISIFLLCFSAAIISFAQHGIAFQHLRNATFQSTNYNPALMPEGTIFLGLPVISGVGFYANNRFSYNDLFRENESGGKTIDIANTINELGVNNIVSGHANIGLFHLGVRSPTGHAVTLFANERVEADFTYPKNLPDWVWSGNGAFISRDVNLSATGITANYFREYGIGYAFASEELGLKVGIRAKMYQGMANVSTPANLKVNVLTENENFQLNVENANVTLRTAGVEILQNSDNPIDYLIANNNRGFGIDFGFEKKINRYYTFALGITDVGFISWNEGIKNYSLADTTLRYTGVPLKGIRDLLSTVQDSLLDKFSIDENAENYRTLAVARANANFIYTPLPYLDVITTVTAKLVQGLPKMGYGVGLRGHLGSKLIASASVTRLPQQFFNIGAGLTLGAGPVQIYAAVDKVLGYSAPNMQWAEGQLGLNFVFGNKTRFKQARQSVRSNSREERIITEPKGVVSGTFMGSRVNVKRYDGLYTIIKKQPKSEARTVTPVQVTGDHERNKIQSASDANKSSAPKKDIRSASGQEYKNDYKSKKIRSATSSQSKGSFDKKKTKIRSVSGSSMKNARTKKKIKSGSGG